MEQLGGSVARVLLFASFVYNGHAACIADSSGQILKQGNCEMALQRVMILSPLANETKEHNVTQDIQCFVEKETDNGAALLADQLIATIHVIVNTSSCLPKENIAKIAQVVSDISDSINMTDTMVMNCFLNVIKFVTINGIDQVATFASQPQDAVNIATAVLSSLNAVITEIKNHTFPPLTNRSEGTLTELNCSLPTPTISLHKAKELLHAKGNIATIASEIIENFILRLQTLITPNILIDAPPFYIYTQRMKLMNLKYRSYPSPYGAVTVGSDVSSTNESLLTINDNIITMFTGIGVNILAGNASAGGMDTTVVRLDVYSTSAQKLTHVVQAETTVEIQTNEDKIKAETECSAAYTDCDNTTAPQAGDGIINKESHSTFYVSPDSNTLRFDVDRNETYKLYMSASGKPTDTSYDLFVERDENSNIWVDEGIDSEDGGDDWEPPTWDLDVKLDGQKLYLFIGAGNGSDEGNATTVQVVVQQSQAPGEGDTCDYITLSAANIDIVSFQGDRLQSVEAKITPDSTKEKTKFKSNFLGTFTVDLFYPPNTIDFSTVFEDFASKIADNWLVLATIILMLALSLLLGGVMRWLDKKDCYMWEFLPLSDNAAWHTHAYKLSIQTGKKGGSLGKEKVKMKLIGDNGFSGPRELDDGERKNFRKSTLSNFTMTTFGGLGQLQKVEFWLEDAEDQNELENVNFSINALGDDNVFHDPNTNNNNSNSDDDVNTNNNNAGLKNGGQSRVRRIHIDRVSIADVMRSERYFFDCDLVIDNSGMQQKNQAVPAAMENSVKNFWFLFNNHAKTGIFDDHLWLSTFKRPSVSHFTRLQRLGCCVSALFLAMIGSCMWYKTEVKSSAVGVDIGPIKLTWHAVYTGTLVTLMVLPVNMAIVFVFQKVRAKEEELSMSVSKKKRFALPRWCLIPAWILLILSVLVSAFFTFLYSIDWGSETANEWLVSQIVGTMENIVLFQSVKVFILAIFFAIVLKLPSDPVDSNDVTVPVWREPDDPARIKREEYLDRKMFTNIRNIILSVAYVILLLFIAASVQDVRGYYQNEHLRCTFMGSSIKLDQADDVSSIVNTPEELINWLENVVVPFNGKPDVTGDYLMEDDDFYQLGPVRLKQIRHKPDQCIRPNPIDKVVHDCHGASRSFHEDSNDYGVGWTTYDPNMNLTVVGKYFIHKSAGEVDDMPTSGSFDTYSGGGYIIDLSMDYNSSLQIIADLRRTGWISSRMKALIVEVTVYNGNINLFTIIKLICEKSDLGSIFVQPKIQSFRLYTYVGSTGILVISCQVLWVLLLTYFIIRESLLMKKLRCKYFKSIWNLGHLLHLLLAFASIVLFLARIPHIMHAVERVHNEHGTFVSFDKLAFWDEYFIITLSFVLFFAVLELLRFFQFIRQLSTFLATIKHSIQSLMAYSIVFGVAFWAYCILGFLWLGATVDSFKTVISSAETLMSCMLGKMSKDLVSFRDNTVGMLYFMTYVVIVTFILVDVFITIMNDTYEKIQTHPELSPYDEDLADHMSMRFSALWRSIFGGEEIELVEKLDDLCEGLDMSYQVNWDRFMITACEIIKDEKKNGPEDKLDTDLPACSDYVNSQPVTCEQPDHEEILQKMNRPDYYLRNETYGGHPEGWNAKMDEFYEHY